MYWVMVGVIAVVVFGVAAVASGQGGAMSPAHPDRPDAGLPPGPVGAAELGAVRFGVALRGYRMDEVDAFVDRVAAELAERDRVLEDMEWRLHLAQGRLREAGED